MSLLSLFYFLVTCCIFKSSWKPKAAYKQPNHKAVVEEEAEAEEESGGGGARGGGGIGGGDGGLGAG